MHDKILCYQFIVEQCKKRWKALRSSYLRDLAQKKGVSGQAAVEDSGWKYSAYMEFLKEHVRPRRYVGSYLYMYLCSSN